MTKLQERAMARIRHFADTYLARKHVTYTLDVKQDDQFAWVVLETHRDDCDEYSPRAVICKRGFFAHITRRGKLVFHTSYSVSRQAEELKHFARMMKGSVNLI